MTNYTKTWSQIEKEKRIRSIEQYSGTQTLGAFFAFMILLAVTVAKAMNLY